MPWTNRLANLFRDRRLTADLDDELAFHLESRVRDNIARGMSPVDARRDALLRFGKPALVRERTRDTEILVWLESFAQDVRYALRGLRRNPGFTAVALLALALGIGANTAIFTIVHAVLIRPLPFPESDRLQMLTLGSRRGWFALRPGLADSVFLDFQRVNRSFESLATFNPYHSANLTGAGDPAHLSAPTVTADFWRVLRVGPAATAARPIVLSDHLWRARFNADPGIAGKSITLDGVPQVVAGVMPPGFNFPAGADLWQLFEVRLDPHNSSLMPVVGRLRPGVTPQQAQSEFRSLAPVFAPGPRGYTPQTWAADVQPLKELLVDDVRESLLIFGGAVGFVMLIACANFANLLLIRASSRRREIAARAALGAGRARLIRQLLTEGTLLSVLGGLAGILLARWAVPVLLALAPEGRIPRAEEIRVDGFVLLATLALALVTGLVFGLAPAMHAVRSLTHTFTKRREGVRSTLAIAEIAMALILVTGAGLLLQSFLRMSAVDPGFRADRVAALSVVLPNSYRDARVIQSLHQRMVDQLSAIPGAASAAAVNWMPFHLELVRGDFILEGGRKIQPAYMVDKPVVTPGYFATMGIKLLAGRDFDMHDSTGAPGAVIVSQSVARYLWPAGDALGKRISMSDHPKPEDWLAIVGIVNDIRQTGFTEPPDPAVYLPVAQVASRGWLNQMTYVVRSQTDSRPILSAMRDALHSVDPNLPSVSIVPVTSLLDRATAEPRFKAWLIGAFSFLALLLASIGVYGVLACTVVERTREIGIRIALGAQRERVIGMILRRTLTIAIAGIVVGAAGALALTRLLAKVLFDIKPGDPATFLGGAALLAAVALAAALVPARRAATVDPLLTIRDVS